MGFLCPLLNHEDRCDYVLACLRKLEEQYGGYYGTDLLSLAIELDVTLSDLKKMLGKWLKEDSAFASLPYYLEEIILLSPLMFMALIK